LLVGPQTINDMAERLGLDRTTLTRNLKPIAQGDYFFVQKSVYALNWERDRYHARTKERLTMGHSGHHKPGRLCGVA
jgi:DNA-binding MarR family transcriptional regulator